MLSFICQDKIKNTLSQQLYQNLLQNVDQPIDSLFPNGEETIYFLLTEPPQKEWGHYAFPCFSLAKTLKKKPPLIASEIEKNWKCTHPLILKVQAKGPYLNFYLTPSLLPNEVLNSILEGKYFEVPLLNNPPKTMIEYSQPNTHKELHVGHMRNLCLGHSLVLLKRYCGYNVLSSTFPGDVGTHVAKCLWFLKNHNKEQVPGKRKGAWLGKLYSAAHNKLEDEKNTDSEEKNRQELTLILAQLENKQGEYYELWKETRNWSLELMKDLYKWSNVDFDYWYWESDVDSPSIELAKKYYQEGIFTESEGAIGMDLSEDKLGFCLMIKSDGNGLYATKDLELARRKFEEHNIEKSLYVVDVRQSLHFSQVFKVLEKIGFPHAKDCIHLPYDFVEVPSGAMSSRKGNIIPIQDLIDQMVNMIKKNYLDSYIGNWSNEEIEKTAHMVALGAINYGMLRIDPNRKIVFDMKEWLKLDGESGPYLQYVCARISSLLQKGKEKSPSLAMTNPYQLHWDPQEVETELIFKLSHFNQIVLSSSEQYKPAYLCAYLYDLGKLFNHFYAECPILTAATPSLQTCRYHLAEATHIVLKKGLALLGIPTPERM